VAVVGDERRRRLVAVVVGVLAIAALVGGSALLRGDEPAGFRLDGTRIVAPDGKPFVPVGMNLLGPDAFFNADGRTAGLARVLADDWRVNTVRLNLCLPRGCSYTDVHNQHNDDLDALVAEYTGQGLVVVLALHQVQPGHWPSPSELDDIGRWWADKARRFGHNPYVWFNLLNEPGHGTPASGRWLDVHRRLLRAVRDGGGRNLVVVDGSNWGQDAGGSHGARVATADSSILRYGARLRALDDRVLFSFHAYDQWGPPDLDTEGRDRRLADYIDRAHRAGLALMIGEAGGVREPCCDPRSLGTKAAYRVAPGRGVGILAWHGQAVDELRLVVGDGAASPADIDDPEQPTNLTWQGTLLWNLARKLDG
jgi:mannan endo-1,4-beta-mannosidase